MRNDIQMKNPGWLFPTIILLVSFCSCYPPGIVDDGNSSALYFARMDSVSTLFTGQIKEVQDVIAGLTGRLNDIGVRLVVLEQTHIQTQSDSVLVSWGRNTEQDLAGYKLYWGVDVGRGITLNQDTLVWGEAQGLVLETPGLYGFAVAAFDSSGNESMLSDTVFFCRGSDHV